MNNSNTLEFFTPKPSKIGGALFLDTGISAGFPIPADDFETTRVSLDEELIKNKSTTFFAKVKGHSMKNAGIYDGDLLVIDKSLEPQDGKIAICQIDGEFTVKRIKKEKDMVWLVAENEEYQPIKVTVENELMIWGIVVHSIKSF
jgi:DNA polymerase V